MGQDKKKFRTFLMMWCGEFVSNLGSRVTGFSLGIWAYRQTGSAAQYAMIAFFSILPGLIMTPIAGVLVDRFDKRKLMLIGNLLTAYVVLIGGLLFLSARLQVWHLYLLVTFRSICYSCVEPAYSTSIILLISKKQLGRISGMIAGTGVFIRIFSPMIAGILYVAVGLSGILLVDFISFFASFIVLLFIRIPRPETPKEGVIKSFVQSTFSGFRHLWLRLDLRILLVLNLMVVFFLNAVSILLTPMILTFSTPEMLGIIVSCGGCGMLAGSILMIAWGGPKKQIPVLLRFRIMGGFFIMLAGISTIPILLAIIAFCCYFSFSMSGAIGQTIWRKEVAPHIQGRVFAMRSMLIKITTLAATLGSGLLAEYIFEPVLQHEGLLAKSLGTLIGTGPGRGIAFLFMVAGFLLIISGIAGFFCRSLREIDLGPTQK